MQLRKRGLRPQLGDSVVIAKADDPRDGQEATVVQVKQPGAIPPISPHISLYLPQAIVQQVKEPGAIPPISPYISRTTATRNPSGCALRIPSFRWSSTASITSS